MKRVFSFLFLLPLIISPTQTFAQENWVINSFDSEIRILENGKVSVVETIDVDFGSLQKHGIFRDLPVIYTLSDGNKRYRCHQGSKRYGVDR